MCGQEINIVRNRPGEWGETRAFSDRQPIEEFSGAAWEAVDRWAGFENLGRFLTHGHPHMSSKASTATGPSRDGGSIETNSAESVPVRAGRHDTDAGGCDDEIRT